MPDTINIDSFDSVKDILEFSQDSCYVGIDQISDILDDTKRPRCDQGLSDILDIIGYTDKDSGIGVKISELPLATSSEYGDLLLVDSKTISGTQTRSIKTECIFSQFLDQFKKDMHIGSMASKESYNYAKVDHIHENVYSKVEISVNGNVSANQDSISILQISANEDYLSGNGNYESIYDNPSKKTYRDTVLDIKYLQPEIPLPPKPMIGTLKFVSARTIGRIIDQNEMKISYFDGICNVDPYDSDDLIRDDFDGWVFPNGAVIPNEDSQLSDASFVFNGDESSDIHLPSLSDYVQIFNGNGSYEISDRIECQTGLRPHQHTVNPSIFNGSLKQKDEVTWFYKQSNCTTKAPSQGSLHHGTYKNGSTMVSGLIEQNFSINLQQMSFSNLSSSETGTDSPSQFKPRHTIVPVMIYIGGETRQYYINS